MQIMFDFDDPCMLQEQNIHVSKYYRLAAMASASSKKIMLGAAMRARRNVSRNNPSPSPTNMEYNSAPL